MHTYAILNSYWNESVLFQEYIGITTLNVHQLLFGQSFLHWTALWSKIWIFLSSAGTYKLFWKELFSNEKIPGRHLQKEVEELTEVLNTHFQKIARGKV